MEMNLDTGKLKLVSTTRILGVVFDITSFYVDGDFECKVYTFIRSNQ